MTLQKDVEALRNIALFRKIEPAKLKLLAFTSEHLEFMPGETLFHQGDVGDAAYILLEGDADVMVETPNGALKVATLHQNDIVGEIAILCDVPRTASVVAANKLVTLRVSKDGFFNLVTQFPQVGVEIMHELASRLHHTTQQLGDATAKLRTMQTGAG
ncbi:MAG: cyclic nucleotide-binding domain-containing protein [Geminicoccaceae bacterium]|jgi:CRP-like cAMP-binding protein|nr:cyclic nucleotide-binding domain-containing protein [Geminicoccaceae bacterium]HRY25885.1 cyclic nucleotide-binding domain-containing protein [Geminicoccaceae bacterium]